MGIVYPVNCINNNSKWSFLWAYFDKLREWRNQNCNGKTKQYISLFEKNKFHPLQNTIVSELLIIEKNIVIEKHWKPVKEDSFITVDNNIDIKFHASINKNNEGSRGAFCLELLKQFSNIDSDEAQATSLVLSQAKADAKAGLYWKSYINLSEL